MQVTYEYVLITIVHHWQATLHIELLL